MRRSFFSLTAVLLVAIGLCQAQRLPGDVTPQHYDLTIEPDLQQSNFSGQETIVAVVQKPTQTVILNSVGLTFDNVTIASANGSFTPSVTTDEESQIVSFTLPGPLPAGEIKIQLRYRGNFNKLSGLYLTQKDTYKYAVTQFEPADARRVFASFDEPKYRATYAITVLADRDDTAISNSKIASDTPVPETQKHLIKFATTAKLPTYLVALAIGRFDCLEDTVDDIAVRVCASPGTKELGHYALNSARDLLHYYGQYFGVKYPFGKLDLVAIPDMWVGAMENTGAIFTRDNVLLTDDNKGSIGQRKGISEALSHLIANQWFGGLVSMEWWDDSWLTATLAHWASRRAMKELHVPWNVAQDEVQSLNTGLDLDSYRAVRAMHSPVNTPTEAKTMFDIIAYEKGPSVLRMVEAYTGAPAFQRAIKLYLTRHAFGSATTQDFVAALADAAGKPAAQILTSFVNQPGAPVIKLQTQCVANKLQVKAQQQRYFYDRTLLEQSNNQLFTIPICFAVSADATRENSCFLLSKAADVFSLGSCRSNWVMANPGSVGYYRVSYDSSMLREILLHANTALSPEEKVALLNSVWGAVRVGKEPIGDYLQLVEAFTGDKAISVIEALTAQLDYIGDNLVTDHSRARYQQWVREVMNPLARDLGWQRKPDETTLQAVSRAHVLYTLGYTGRDAEVLAHARQMVQDYLRDRSSVEPTLVRTSLYLAAFKGDQKLFDQYLAAANAAATPEEFYSFVFALTKFGDPELLAKTYQYLLSANIRLQDRVQPVEFLLQNPIAKQQTWDFTKNHWSDVLEKLPPVAPAWIAHSLRTFCDANVRNDIEQFFTTHPIEIAKKEVKLTTERIDYCVDLKAQQQANLDSWLEKKSFTSSLKGAEVNTSTDVR